MSAAYKVRLNNPRMLVWAREETAVSVEEMASYLGKSADDVRDWEEGRGGPTFRQLEQIAAKLKRPLSAFFLPTVPERPPLPEDHRTLPGTEPGVFAADTLYAFRAVRAMLLETRELLDEMGHSVVYALPHWTRQDSPDTIAEDLRSRLGISVAVQIKELASHYAALDRWRNALFDHGVVTRVCRMPLADARGFCMFGHDLAGIGLSSEDREHGRIFSLFHEVCHLLLRLPGVSSVVVRGASSRGRELALEHFCDRFAAAFLMPASCPEVHQSLEELGSNFAIYNAQRVAGQFKVSKYVAARRALDLGYVSEAAYWKATADWAEMDRSRAKTATRKRGGGDHNVTQVSYAGRRFVSLLLSAVDAGLVTTVEAGQMIGIAPTAVEALL